MERKLSKNQRRRYSELKLHEGTLSSSQAELFIPAINYPSFFDDNLVDQDRKIKIFKNNRHTHEIIFYFQLLKLIFQCEESDYEKYLQKIYDLLENQEFQIVVPKYNSPYYVGLSNIKIKKVLTDFLEEMGEGQLGVQEGLKKYPILNKLFVLFFRSILIVAQQCSDFDEEVQASDIYDLLANYFQIEITYYGNCLRFNQVDVFVYLQDNHQIYLAYISPSISQQEILESSELYHNDPTQVFNISSVKQMVSEIDIPVDTECFNTTKHNDNLEDTEEVQYNYSHSEDVRIGSRSIQEASELKFSYLINDDSLQNLNIIKSNKILEKELIGEKKIANNHRFMPQIDCYKIEEVPLQLQNALSPTITPRQTKIVCFNTEESQKFDKANIYRKKKSANIRDIIREQYELLSTYESGFKKQEDLKELLKQTSDTEWSGFKRQSQKVFEQVEVNKPATTLKSLYDGKSFKSICGSENQSCLIGESNFKLSKFSSRTATIQNKFEENLVIRQDPSRSSKNVSGDFTNSFVLRQMQEPYQSNIRTMKTRARDNRSNVKKLMIF